MWLLKATKPCATTKGFLLKVTGNSAVIRLFLWSFTEFIALDNKVTNFCDSLAIM